MINLTFGSVLISHLALIDLAVFVVFGVIHVLSWPSAEPQGQDAAEARNRTAGTLTAAITGGLTAVGILLPLSLVAIQVVYSSKPSAQAGAVGLNLLVADMWLALSLIMALFALWVIWPKASTRNVLYTRLVGVPFGLQLISLVLGVGRIVVAVFVLVNAG